MAAALDTFGEMTHKYQDLRHVLVLNKTDLLKDMIPSQSPQLAAVLSVDEAAVATYGQALAVIVHAFRSRALNGAGSSPRAATQSGL